MRLAEPTGGIIAVAMTTCLLTSIAASESYKQKQLRVIERSIVKEREKETTLGKQFRSQERELAELRLQSIELARRTQENEALITQLEQQLYELYNEAKSREKLLSLRRGHLSMTLGALERLSLNPPHSILIRQGTPLTMIRSAILLRTTLPTLTTEAETLSKEISTLKRVKNDIRGQSIKLKDSTSKLEIERAQLLPIMQRKAKLQIQTKQEKLSIKKNVRILSDKAQTLRELMTSLSIIHLDPSKPKLAPKALSGSSKNALLKKPEGIKPFPNNDLVVLPARGLINKRYGDAAGFGNTSRGITIITRERAQIVAPHDGKVVFAGSFRRYGKILIIQHGGGYHTVLAGLAEIKCIVGQWLLAGEPVGFMGTNKVEETTLYLELRRNGQPINPSPWMMANGEKVRG